MDAVRRELRAWTAKVAARSTAAAALPRTLRATRPITSGRYTGRHDIESQKRCLRGAQRARLIEQHFETAGLAQKGLVVRALGERQGDGQAALVQPLGEALRRFAKGVERGGGDVNTARTQFGAQLGNPPRVSLGQRLAEGFLHGSDDSEQLGLAQEHFERDVTVEGHVIHAEMLWTGQG